MIIYFVKMNPLLQWQFLYISKRTSQNQFSFRIQNDYATFITEILLKSFKGKLCLPSLSLDAARTSHMRKQWEAHVNKGRQKLFNLTREKLSQSHDKKNTGKCSCCSQYPWPLQINIKVKSFIFSFPDKK